MPELIDGCGRRIDHLRLSVTSRCDLRCQYCRPRGEGNGEDAPAQLTDAQRLEFVDFLVQSYGLQQVRLTGGEPLIYPGLVPLIAALHQAHPQLQLAMTTSGTRLTNTAAALRAAGLNRLNISLDTLDDGLYSQMTGGRLGDVLAGIEAAVAAGFGTLKINAVLLRDVNTHEILRLTEWALQRGFELRFLEAMPIGPAAGSNQERFVPCDEALEVLRSAYDVEAMPFAQGDTARRYRLRRGELEGAVGMIAPVSRPFCGSCRRMRLTADGRMFPCLLDRRSVNMHAAWSGGRFDASLADAMIREAVAEKVPRGPLQQPTRMVVLGG
jgi:cyclic pyranopterin phosphate synthase